MEVHGRIILKREEFQSSLKERGLELTERQMEQFDEYASFLAEYNEKVNLTAITEYEEILEKHFYDCILPFLKKEMKGTLADVGSGAGFPGAVLKIAFPELKVVLLEPIRKRCVFLEELIARLKLKDISVINTRGEDHSLMHREEYDHVTARAVSNLNMLIEVCGAMVKEGGYFIALRGNSGEEEIKGARTAFETMGFEEEEVFSEYLPDGSKRVIGYYRKCRKTPKKYPRKYSIIKQKSL